LQRCQHRGPVLFNIDRSPAALQFAHAGITVDSNQKAISMVTGRLEVSHMSEMKHIEATVRHDQFLSSGSNRGSPSR
jgi:hypothetical protein